jgi:DNA-binding CsgD family transcriptional regulator
VTARPKKKKKAKKAKKPSQPGLRAPSRLELSRMHLGSDEYALFSFPLPGFSSPVQLTAAEREVLALLLEGLSGAEIAERRGTSVHTLNNQMRAIYRKLGVGSRSELVALCRSDPPSSR